MKKAFLIIVLLLLLSCVGSFITLQPAQGTFSYEDAIAENTDSFSSLLEWVSEYYVSTKHAIDIQDRQAGLIVIKATFITGSGFGKVYYNYMLKIKVDSNLIKTKFTTLPYENNQMPVQSALPRLRKHADKIHSDIIQNLSN